MTTTQQKRDAAEAKYTKIAFRITQILLDNVKQPGYYGEETLVICGSDGVITHAKRGGQQTIKN